MKYSFPGCLRLALVAVCAGSVFTTAIAQQSTPDDPIQRRFYSALATAAQNVTTENTKKIGGGGGGRFFEVSPEGGILVGFDVWTGDWSGHKIIRGIRPIFQTARGRVPGQRHGVANGNPVRVEAKEGYAVAAIEARGGDRLDGFEILYWKIHPSDINLDAEGSYKSEWIGGGGGHRFRHPLTSNGNPVIGIAGASGEDVDRLGLVYYDRH